MNGTKNTEGPESDVGTRGGNSYVAHKTIELRVWMNTESDTRGKVRRCREGTFFYGTELVGLLSGQRGGEV